MITNLEDAENKAWIEGFERCARIKDGLSITAFFAGIMTGLLIAMFITWRF